MDEFEEKPTLIGKLKNFVKECVRVLKVTKKPTKEEFKTISKISGLGILVIGLIGFLVHLIDVLVFK
ncbi:TPA: protein translocase SEC61 complex subunit gamma [Candidatus Woesearchaeota archaeon]|nr:protein translocase SEC61 complex subunit gamma [Candidatus Woesearchaeota archaeon]HIH31265.1 protein translocase SEC61 complex subunit gamma [Candidatus Woesearchaeota archaeon]HIH54852.1 protein translocase SEC61 complex subunit gamma [Candidatus Woesearchaeota archaeon]HIJ01757.1 protein translocase SEC61 complex subunit gamma [Candidatus Woesearchaeota archaeon]HIJ13520.1 protein translocase SEC61 complex subunit gamma [Candidatus Woesearchaeota archaeon]